MRTLKFRVWNDKNKEWIHGPHERNDMDGVNLFGETILLGGLMDGVSLEDLNDCYAVQYTGLKDKKGKDIFEGDILIWEKEVCSERGEFEDYVERGRGEVYFEHGSFLVKNLGNLLAGLSDWKLKVYQVIGNIFDNPELKESQRETNPIPEEPEESVSDLDKCEQCGEPAWDGYICHSCGMKVI